MYVRLTTLHGSKGTVEAGVDFVEGTARAAMEASAGNRGFASFTDAAAGVVVGASYWDDERSRADSEIAMADLRAEYGKVGGGDVTFENYEAVVLKRLSVPGPGALVRIIRAQADPGQVEALIEHYRSDLLPMLTAPAGVCSAQLLVDRATGRGLGVTSWTDEESLHAARPSLEAAGRSAQERVSSLRFAGTELYTIVRTTVRMD